MTFSVTDENNVAVSAALITIGTEKSPRLLRCETDYAGHCTFSGLAPGTYIARIQKANFYQLTIPNVRVGFTESLDITLHHEQEIHESVDVIASPPAIDPEHTARTETLTTGDILNVPYPTSRDIRQALPLLPSVVMDLSGNIHIAGATVAQTLNILDGFNIGGPTTTFMPMHVSADAVRAIDVETSRYSAQYGKGISTLGLQTGTGDDKFRFSATNFIPSFQFKRGLHFNQWVPRAVFSGPIVKGRAWFFDSPDAEYDQSIFTELPEGSDRSTSWRFSNLAKFQVNVTPSNMLSAEFLVNTFHAPNAGLSAFNPLESTINERENTWIGTIRDQHYFQSGLLLETGFAADQFENSFGPQGTLPYVLRPGNTSGSYFEANNGNARRLQGLTNVYLPPAKWHGRHDVKLGVDIDRLTYTRVFQRDPIQMLRTDGTLARESTFPGAPHLSITNVETSAYVQDRWSISDRLLLESGLRFDWDEIIRAPLFSPRIAASYMIGNKGDTKISGGVGVFYQATNLDLIARPQTGQRIDKFFAPDGTTPVGTPQATQFSADRNILKEPRFLNWSIALEHRLPHQIYGRIDFTQRFGSNGLAYVNRNPAALVGQFDLLNGRTDRYYGLTLSARHTFGDKYPVFAAYTRSSARTNEVFDFNLGTPVIGFQQPGPFSWDTPNRVVSWGWAPFPWHSTLGYALEWHNGFPFTAVDQFQRVAGPANSLHFPQYFNLTLSVEHRFHLAGYYLALRAAVEDVTGRQNPFAVDNNIDSPRFFTFSSTDHRSLTARIRFLGHSKGNPPATPQGAGRGIDEH